MSARELDAVERRLVWILGSPRTGTTWLLHMLAAHVDAVPIDEPQIGMHLVLFSPDILGLPGSGFSDQSLIYNDWRSGADDYFFSRRYADVWEPALRRMVLERFAAQARTAGAGPRAPILIKEPNGSQAALLLSRLLPASRLLVVWRDGRDVVDSQLDASGKGAWMEAVGGGRELDAQERLAYVTERALRWRARTQVVRRAYDGHEPARRMATTYEALLAAPAATIEQIASWLGAAVKRPASEVTQALAFDTIDPEHRGKGKFARAATPGLWRTSLSRAEQQRVNDLLREELQLLGYED